MTQVFVYGTLKRGGSNHRFLAGQKFIGEARTVAGYTLYSLGNYPGMVHSTDTSHIVTGEVWQVNDPCLAQLDKLEGIDEGLYSREVIALESPFDRESVVTYLYSRSVEGRAPLGAKWPT